MAKQYKNDVFEVLKQIDYKNYGYYDSLKEDNKKEIQPFTLSRWMSAIYGSEKDHIDLTLKVNNIVNSNFWELSKYKDLQWKLLCACGNKKFNKHQWLAQNKVKKDKNYNLMRKIYSNLNDDEFELKYKEMTSKDFKSAQQFLGLLDK